MGETEPQQGPGETDQKLRKAWIGGRRNVNYTLYKRHPKQVLSRIFHPLIAGVHGKFDSVINFTKMAKNEISPLLFTSQLCIDCNQLMMRLCVVCVEDCVQALRMVWPEFRRTEAVTL